MKPHAAAPTAYVDDIAARYDQLRFTTRAGMAMHRAEFACLMQALKRVSKDAKILEVGCGTGRLLLEARDAGYQVNGLDASPDMLELLRQKAGDRYPDLTLELGEAAKLPFENSSHDLVYAIRVLSPTGSREYALRTVTEMLRLVKPGGYMLVEFQNVYRPRLGFAKKPSTRLTPREVADQGRAAGGEVVAYLGTFFLSMQAYQKLPDVMANALGCIDRMLSAMFPRLCSRSYVMFRKTGGA